MIVTRIALKNIRSYSDGEEASVDLPEGVVLLEGDIGSGKSTLLYALEFALFGIGDNKGSHLLSEGRSSGQVSVTLNIGGSMYRVERHLKAKGSDVVQDTCYFSDSEGRTRLSPSDLKEKVVGLLGFNEPTHPRAESLVYRYAVFTPQERMKDILTQNAEERLQVIRRVLGAQTYQSAAENSVILQRRLNRQAYGLKSSSKDLPEKQRDLSERTQKLADLDAQIPRLEEEASRASSEVRTAEAKWAELEAEGRRLSSVAGRIPLLERDVHDLESGLADDEDQARASQDRLDREVIPRMVSFASMPSPDAPLKVMKATRESLREELSLAQASRMSAQADLARTNELVSKGVCPYCGQLVSEDVSKRSGHLESELARLDGESKSLSARVADAERDLDLAERWEEARADNDRAAEDRRDLEQSLLRLRRRIEDSRAKLENSKSELAEASQKAAEAREVSARIDSVRVELAAKKKLDKEASDRLSKASADREDLASRVAELEEEVRTKEAAAAHSRKLTSHEEWVSDFFKPSVEEIERQTLAHAASSFNGHFQRFFASLVEDPDIMVKVREDFSPVFERQGFEQEYDALSGGERTSVALAYRFALNSVIGEDFSSSPELVILDEPTDGFSREQVFKLRGLLQALQSRQVIIVSHERELESMVDHIFRIEKTNGTSHIQRV